MTNIANVCFSFTLEFMHNKQIYLPPFVDEVSVDLQARK